MRGEARAVLAMLRSPRQRRHFLRWLASFQRDYLLRQRMPWLAFDVIDYLNTIPIQGKLVFEYGSGGSTLYWLSRDARLTSIEHDPLWYRLLRDGYLKETAVDYRLVPPEPAVDQGRDPADPDAYVSSSPALARYSFQRYCSQIDDFADRSLDGVVIDGRARPSCLKHAWAKVKAGGFLVLDNSDRAHYLRRTTQYLRDYDSQVFSGAAPGAWWPAETTVFRRRV